MNLKLSKINILLALLMGFNFYACKKEINKDDKPPAQNTEITTPPESFESKAVIEMFTGEWCDACPPGQTKLKELTLAYPNKIYGVKIHYADFLEGPFYNSLAQNLGGVGAYPTASVNRSPAVNAGSQTDYVIYSKEYWETNANRFINKKVGIGLAMESKLENGKVSLKIKTFSNGTISALNAKLVVYIIENNILALEQKGAAADYKHFNSARALLTSVSGDAINIPDMVIAEKNFAFDLPTNWNAKEIYFLAFIATQGGNTSERNVINAQQSRLGEIKNWD